MIGKSEAQIKLAERVRAEKLATLAESRAGSESRIATNEERRAQGWEPNRCDQAITEERESIALVDALIDFLGKIERADVWLDVLRGFDRPRLIRLGCGLVETKISRTIPARAEESAKVRERLLWVDSTTDKIARGIDL